MQTLQICKEAQRSKNFVGQNILGAGFLGAEPAGIRLRILA